jgi:hypothetical protein
MTAPMTAEEGYAWLRARGFVEGAGEGLYRGQTRAMLCGRGWSCTAAGMEPNAYYATPEYALMTLQAKLARTAERYANAAAELQQALDG